MQADGWEVEYVPYAYGYAEPYINIVQWTLNGSEKVKNYVEAFEKLGGRTSRKLDNNTYL
jgi:hypothetical protein